MGEEWWEEVEGEEGSMSWGLVEEGRGEASGTGDPICLVLCWSVIRGGETTSGGTTLTFWSELPRGQGEGIGRTSWRDKVWSTEGEKKGISSKKVTSADM